MCARVYNPAFATASKSMDGKSANQCDAVHNLGITNGAINKATYVICLDEGTTKDALRDFIFDEICLRANILFR